MVYIGVAVEAVAVPVVYFYCIKKQKFFIYHSPTPKSILMYLVHYYTQYIHIHVYSLLDTNMQNNYLCKMLQNKISRRPHYPIQWQLQRPDALCIHCWHCTECISAASKAHMPRLLHPINVSLHSKSKKKNQPPFL